MIDFWRYLDLPLIICEIELDSTLSKYCVISEISWPTEVGGANPADATLTTRATFQVNNDKLYIPVVTLSINNNIKFLENIN